jgi:general secretion pathway protein K
MKPVAQNSESGVVLIVVLGGILVLALIAFALTSSVRVADEELENRKEQLQSHYLARGGVLISAAFLTAASATSQQATIKPGQRSVEWNEDQGHVSIEIMDENGKIDLNQASEQILERLLVALGSESGAASTLATTIVEWRNSSSLARWNSAVQSGNLLQFNPSQTTQINYRSIEELLTVPGVTPSLYYGHYVRREDGRIERRPGLMDCVTVDSKSAVININYAPYPVLLAALGLEHQVADYIVTGRERKPFTSPSDITSEFPASLSADTLSTLTTASSGRFSLVAVGRTPAGIIAQVQAVVKVGDVNNGPFQILRWQDSYAR